RTIQNRYHRQEARVLAVTDGVVLVRGRVQHSWRSPACDEGKCRIRRPRLDDGLTTAHHTASPGSTIVGRPCAAFGGMPFGRPSGGREVGRRSGISRRSSLSLDREINAYPIGYRIEPHTPVRTSGSVSSRSRAGAGALAGVPA